MSNEHDMTKLMLESIRKTQETHKTFITEGYVNNDAENDDSGLNTPEAKDEISKFTTTVAPADITSFKIDSENKNVTMIGRINDGIDFQFSLSDGLFINTDNLELTDNLTSTIKKLNGYFSVWKGDWAEKINEY